MLLRELYDLHEKLPIVPAGYKPLEVRYIAYLDTRGVLTDFTDRQPRSERVLAPTFKRSGSNPQAVIATDNLQFALGLAKTPAGQAYADRCHANYLKRLEDCIAVVDSADREWAEQLRAILSFTKHPGSMAALVERGVAIEPNTEGRCEAADHRISFRINGSDPTELPSVRGWWATQVAADTTSAVEGFCQITQTRGPIAKKFDSLALSGNQPTLISGNFAATLRYGSSQGTGASISVEAALKTHQSLNWLLRSPSHHRKVGNLTFVWWCATDLGVDPVRDVIEPDPERVLRLLESPLRGSRSAMSAAPFRLLTLSVNTARVVIRFDHTSTLDEVDRRLHRWFSLVKVPGRDGRPWWPSIGRLAGSAMAPGTGTAREAQRDRISATLVRAVFEGRVQDQAVLNAAVARCRAERSVDGPRAALLTVLTSLDREERPMEPMDESIGSKCGRLLAVLESAQWAALGEINRSVVDAYYSAASTTPQRVFPGLLRRVQPHLRKAARVRPGSQVRIARRISELAELIAGGGGFPAALKISEQADFALGYWRER